MLLPFGFSFARKNSCGVQSKAEIRKSIKYYHHKLVKDSLDQKSTYFIGMCYYKLSSFDTAMNYFSKLILLNPKYPAGYSNRGLCKLILKDTLGSCHDFHESIKNGEDDPFMNGETLSKWIKLNCH
ncbi:MAG: hypothetical protein KA797_01425 [Chitinophagales bacterium]|nr:hypothetical protein [Chitinophagales bacterium]